MPLASTILLSLRTKDRTYDRYPLDTLASYREKIEKAINDPNYIVIVAESSLDETEAEKVYGALAGVYPPVEDQIPPESLKEGKAIVGFASFALNESSEPQGQYPEIEFKNRGFIFQLSINRH